MVKRKYKLMCECKVCKRSGEAKLPDAYSDWQWTCPECGLTTYLSKDKEAFYKIEKGLLPTLKRLAARLRGGAKKGSEPEAVPQPVNPESTDQIRPHSRSRVVGYSAIVLVFVLFALFGLVWRQNKAISSVDRKVDKLMKVNSTLADSAGRIELSAGLFANESQKMTLVVGTLDTNVKDLTSTLNRFQTSTENLLGATNALKEEVVKSGEATRGLQVALRKSDKKLDKILATGEKTSEAIAALNLRLDVAVATQQQKNEEQATAAANREASTINVRVIMPRRGDTTRTIKVSAERVH